VSRSWGECWRIGLAPGSAEVLRVGWFGLGRPGVPCKVASDTRPHADGDVAKPPPPWAGALEALGQALETAGARDGGAGVVLSSHFVRHLVIPWQPELNSARELEALARLRMRTVYGETANSWTIRCSEGGWGEPSVACAVDGELIVALRATLAPRRLRLASVQPALMAAFNARRRSFEPDAAFVVAEPGRCTLALLRGRRFEAVVSRRSGADPVATVEQELATLGAEGLAGGLQVLRVADAEPWRSGTAAVHELPGGPRALAALGVS
jgi:hypothetical protein